MALTAGEIMERHVNSVSEETPLFDVYRLFVEEEIHGAPVVSESDGRVVGVISSADLLRAVYEAHESAGTTSDYLRDVLEFSGPDWASGLPADFQDRLGQLRASDFMTDAIVSVSSETPIDEIARVMRRQRVHRVLVIGDGIIQGIISTFDLIGAFEKQAGDTA